MTTQSTKSHAEWFTELIEAFHRADIDTFMTMYRDDAVHVFPFAPEGMPERIEGKKAIEEWMRQVPDILTLETLSDLRMHESENSLTAEWNSTGHLADGSPVEMSYVAVLTFDGDLVVEYRDYMNPLKLLPALKS